MAKKTSMFIVALLLISCLAVVAPTATADPAPMAGTKRVVIGELFTGAWCGYCPYATAAMSQMESNYERTEVVFLAWHYGDILAFDDGLTRDDWYGVTGYPTAFFDGVVKEVGGSTGTYNNYVNIYNQRTAKASDLRMTVEGKISPTTGTGDVWVNISCVQTPTLANLRLHTVVFENDYGPYNGGNGEDYHNFVAREMIEGADGTSLTLSQGDTKQFHYNIDGSGYAQDYDKLGVIAFVQSHTTKEVLQAAYINKPVLPNVPPILSQGRASPLEGNEDDDYTFEVWYRDPDDTKNRGPGTKRVYIRNGTEAPVEHELTIVGSSDPYTVGKWLRWTGKLLPGSYTYMFNVSDSEDWAVGDVGWNATKVTVRPRNKIPQLMGDNYVPIDGDTTTVFRFDIMYRDLDNEGPSMKTIVIDEVEHTMTTDDTSGVFNDWVTYYYETTLGVGDSHRFFYLFSDGIDMVRFPPASQSPNWLAGPEVLPPNYAPTLTGERFTPATGTRDTEFTFTVTYTDGENDRATTSNIYIDGVARFMMPLGTNFEYGVTYSLSTKLDMGSHMFYFVFSDGDHEVRYPAAGTLDGPTITNLAPEADITAPMTGTRYTPTDYVPFSALGSKDPEGDELTYKWESDLDGLIGDEDTFDVRLSEGQHTITLTVTDEYGAASTTTIELDVRPYLPRPFVKDLLTNVNRPVEQDVVRITVTVSNDGEARGEAIDVRILIDGEEVYTDTVSLDIGADRTVSYSWTSTEGDHTVRAVCAATQMEITVVVLANTPPTAEPNVPTTDPSGAPVKYIPGDIIQFNANSVDANKDALAYEWDFGDGTPVVTAVNPTHSYLEAGTYTVTLKVTDARGGVTTETMTITIEKPPAKESPGLGAACALAAMAALGAIAVARRRRPA